MEQKNKIALFSKKKTENRKIMLDSDEYDVIEEMKEKIRVRKKKFRKHAVLIAAAAIAIVVGGYFLMHHQTYTRVRIADQREVGESGNNSYRQFGEYMLKYSRDGIALLDQRGGEIWNFPYQIKNPLIETNKESLVVGDKGGNTVIVLNEKGMKGEFSTNLPIEKMAVSKQGIVAVLVKNESSPSILIYDAVGNLLAEIKASLGGSGYPVDLCLSEDGETLLVSYMTIKNGVIYTNISFYDFSAEAEKNGDYQIFSEEYENILAPSTQFVDNSTAIVVADDRLLYYSVGKEVKLRKTVPLEKEIKSVAYGDKHVAVVLKNHNAEGYEVSLYDSNGECRFSENLMGEYRNIKMDKEQVILYDGKKSAVFLKDGVLRFEGQMERDIWEIMKVSGLNKYIVMNADGMETVQFVK